MCYLSVKRSLSGAYRAYHREHAPTPTCELVAGKHAQVTSRPQTQLSGPSVVTAGCFICYKSDLLKIGIQPETQQGSYVISQPLSGRMTGLSVAGEDPFD